MEKLIAIVEHTHKIILDIYETQSPKIFYKEDNSPLTEADKQASDYICNKLSTYWPDIPIICEETQQVDYNIRKNWNKFWLVDPLDGTKEFIKKNGQFTVNIALVEGGYPTMGIVGISCQSNLLCREK